jgi:isopentenyl-diphosphate delta-isomerase
MSVVPAAGVEVSQMDPHQAALMAADHCILVNRLDQAIGSSPKQECHLMTQIAAGKGLHRAFSVFLFNEQGELLLQRRAAVKPTFPSRWTNTCCSHPLHGTPEANEENQIGVKLAAIRKMEDELGITGIATSDLHFLTRIHYCALSDGKWGEHEIDHLMFCQVVSVCTKHGRRFV